MRLSPYNEVRLSLNNDFFGDSSTINSNFVPLPDSYRGLYQGVSTVEKYAAHIQDQIDLIRSKNRNVAGFICESIISCGGQIELPDSYLIIAIEAVRKAGGLYIADEVQDRDAIIFLQWFITEQVEEEANEGSSVSINKMPVNTSTLYRISCIFVPGLTLPPP